GRHPALPRRIRALSRALSWKRLIEHSGNQSEPDAMPYREKISSFLFGHAAILVLLTGFCLWYVVDAWTASPTVANLVLIAPLGIAAILIGLTLLIVQMVRGDPVAADGPEPVGGDTIWMIVALVGYVVMMPVTGFTFSTGVYTS